MRADRDQDSHQRPCVSHSLNRIALIFFGPGPILNGFLDSRPVSVTGEGITGTFSNGRLGPRGDRVIGLRRGKSYWQ